MGIWFAFSDAMGSSLHTVFHTVMVVDHTTRDQETSVGPGEVVQIVAPISIHRRSTFESQQDQSHHLHQRHWLNAEHHFVRTQHPPFFVSSRSLIHVFDLLQNFAATE